MEAISEVFQSLWQTLVDKAPAILGALAVLVIGWIVAMIVRAIVRRVLGLVNLNESVTKSTGAPMDVESGVATGAYYFILLFTLVAFFSTLGLPGASESVQSLIDQVLAFLPNLIAGGVLALVAWVIATALKKAATAGLAQTSLDEKLGSEAGMTPMGDTLGNVLYGLVLLLFLPAVLGALGLEGMLGPIQNMVDKTLGMVPNIFGALVIGGVGWFLAGLLRSLITNLLSAAGADKLGERAGLSGTMSLSRLVGLIVFIFVFVPSLIAALNAAKIEAISTPATQMLGTLMNAVPNLFAAGVILAVAFFLSKFVSSLAANLLGGMGFDQVPGKLGISAALPEGTSGSMLVGRLFAFFIMLFAAVEASNVLGFGQVSDIVAVLIEFGGQVLLGVVIIAVGLWISNLAHAALMRMDRPNSALVAGLVRFTILGLVFAMGLRSMGIADRIVDMAFGFTLAAVAVAVALSFGLGGREAAGKLMEHWLSRLRT